MKRFSCRCGGRVFFENFICLSCRVALGFDPRSLQMLSFDPPLGGSLTAADGRTFRPCRNRSGHEVCNWLVPTPSADQYCLACRLNQVIPNLTVPGNLQLWTRLEQAKRRLLYTLIALGLPVTAVEGRRPLSFRFLEDQRRNRLVEESLVLTGHHAGIITINLAEADDSLRHAVREEMRERYRTLLGHFRHESGHYYFEALVSSEPAALEQFRQLFGDERRDYEQAIEAHYRESAVLAPFEGRYVSRYASAHPFEDWAETWAHYLHIVDALETAAACGITAAAPGADRAGWMTQWLELSVTLNELNRSLGMDDPYPFVLSPVIVDKLSFVRRRVERGVASTAGEGGR